MHVTTIKQDRHGNNLHVVYIGFLALLNQSLEFIAIDLSSIDAIVQSDYPKLAQLSQYQEWLKEKKADP